MGLTAVFGRVFEGGELTLEGKALQPHEAKCRTPNCPQKKGVP